MFAKCVQNGEEPETSGPEGLIDVRIIEALRKSYTEHRPVRMEPMPGDSHPDASQSMERSPPREPTPFNADAPAKK